MPPTPVGADFGPFSHANWRAMLQGAAPRIVYECGIFSDAHIIAEQLDGLGPYQLFNNLAFREIHDTRPAIILRITEHETDEPDPMLRGQTDTSRYHGGNLGDEIAALLSLCLGIRARCGGPIRIFELGGNQDPRGKPMSLSDEPDPILERMRGNSILPSTLGEHSLIDAGKIRGLPDLSEKDAVALVRAARLYQHGTWIAESSPETAWLLLVAAIETAAVCHFGSVESVEWQVGKLEEAQPKLTDQLRESGGDVLVAEVARVFSGTLGATKKFVDFTSEFLPEPLKPRPPEYYQLDWSPGAMHKSLRRVYAHRSKAVHQGIPFPAPMCRPPWQAGEGIRAETLPGQAMGTLGAVWKRADIPMSLSTFHHIARGCLLNWWEFLVQPR